MIASLHEWAEGSYEDDACVLKSHRHFMSRPMVAIYSVAVFLNRSASAISIPTALAMQALRSLRRR